MQILTRIANPLRRICLLFPSRHNHNKEAKYADMRRCLANFFLFYSFSFSYCVINNEQQLLQILIEDTLPLQRGKKYSCVHGSICLHSENKLKREKETPLLLCYCMLLMYSKSLNMSAISSTHGPYTNFKWYNRSCLLLYQISFVSLCRFTMQYTLISQMLPQRKVHSPRRLHD